MIKYKRTEISRVRLFHTFSEKQRLLNELWWMLYETLQGRKPVDSKLKKLMKEVNRWTNEMSEFGQKDYPFDKDSLEIEEQEYLENTKIWNY